MLLRKNDVVAGALKLLDAEGLDGLTMRKVAAVLGVQAGALYRHYDNKKALLDAMAEKLVEGVGTPAPTGPWDRQLEILAGRLRRCLLSHRDGARVVAGTFVAESNTLASGKAFLDALGSAGVPPERAGWITFALKYYVFGHTIEEQAQLELAQAGQWPRDVTVEAGHDPAVVIAVRSVAEADPAARFVYGLRLFLDGIAANIPAASRTTPASPDPLTDAPAHRTR